MIWERIKKISLNTQSLKYLLIGIAIKQKDAHRAAIMQLRHQY